MELLSLNPEQVAQFILRGYVRLRGAIPRALAEEAADFLWMRMEESLGIDREDRSTWTQPRARLRELYSEGPFSECLSPYLRHAVEDLVGRGRWTNAARGKVAWGNWGFNLRKPDGEDAWEIPREGWHWDPIEGILVLGCFTDTEPRGGATLLLEGSHLHVARYLAHVPPPNDARGVDDAFAEIREAFFAAHAWSEELTGSRHPHHFPRVFGPDEEKADPEALRIVEAVSEAGDVYLCHPLLVHAGSSNHSEQPRIMCNLGTGLSERVDPNRPAPDLSPLELSLRYALSRGAA